MTQDGMRHSIDEYFKDRLYDLETPVPADVWGKIEGKMKQKRNRLYWSIFGAMAASFALIISMGIGYYFGTKQQISVTASQARELNNSSVESANNGNNIIGNENNIVSNSPGNSVTRMGKEPVFSIGTDERKSPNNKIENNKHRITTILHKVQNKGITHLGTNIKPTLKISQNQMDIFLGLNTDMPEEAEESDYMKDWELGGNVAPLYSYQSTSSTNENAETQISNEKALFAYAGGLNLNYAKNRWRFETGVYYSQEGRKVENVSSSTQTNMLGEKDIRGNSDTWGNEIPVYTSNSNSALTLNSYGNITLNNSQKRLGNVVLMDNSNVKNQNIGKETPLKYQYQYIEIPLIAHYKLIDKKADLSISGGLSTNIMIGNKIFISENGNEAEIGYTGDLQKINYAGNFGLSFEVPLASKLCFRLEPRFRYNINDINKNELFKTHPYSVGVFSGVSYKF